MLMLRGCRRLHHWHQQERSQKQPSFLKLLWIWARPW